MTRGPSSAAAVPGAGATLGGLPAPALRAQRGDDQPRRRVQRLLELLAGVGAAVHERVELHAGLVQRRRSARRGDEHARRARRAQGGDVAAGEVERVDAVQRGPRQRVVAVRDDPLADHGDRPLAVVVDVHEHPPLRRRARRRVDLDPAPCQDAGRAAAELVLARAR